MAARRYTRKSSYFFWAQGVAAGVILFPLSIHQVDFRAAFGLGVAISAHKSSPAYAAFEDMHENFVSDFPRMPDRARPFRRESFQPFGTHNRPVVRQITLNGLTIRGPRPVEVAQPMVIASSTPLRHSYQDTSEILPELTDNSGALLPIAERKRRLVEQLRGADLAQASPASLARELAEAAVSQFPPIEKNYMPPLARSAEPKQVRVASNEESNGYSSFGIHNIVNDNMRPLWLTGQVEMTGGLAFVGPQTQIVVQRVFNGKAYEQGRIWVTEGRFEIRVKEPSGFLVAELRTPDGRVLGRGEINLLDLTDLPPGDRIGDLRIALRPSAEGATLHAVSGYSTGTQKVAVRNARVEIQAFSDPQKVNEDGIVNEPNLSRESSFVARALAQGHWPSLVIGQAREPQDVKLFANSMVDALINLSVEKSARKDAHQQSIVWGQVSRLGKTLSNVQLELAGDNHAIYFNAAYLPDPGLRATSANGLFAFVNVKTGVQAVRVRIGNKIYPAQIFPTEEKHVSYIELEVHDKSIAQFRVLDGLDMNKSVVARVRLVGTDEQLTIGKDTFVEYSAVAGPLMIEADAGVAYEVSRVSVTGSPHVVHIPLVQREWLSESARAHNIAMLQSRGTVVGFMDDHDFEVEMTGYPPGQTPQIIYFDSSGRSVSGKTGVAGGGFVIFNAPSGVQTLYVHPLQSRETFSQVVVAEPEFVQVVTH